MNFIEQTVKRMVDHFEPVATDQFDGLTYPEKCQEALKLFCRFIATGHQLPEAMLTSSNMVALLLPFVMPSKPDAVIRAVSLETEKQLIDDLSGAELPGNIDADYYKHHREFDNWFVQLPDRCFKYSDSMWLSSIFYIPLSGITAIVCQDECSKYIYSIERDSSIQTVPPTAAHIDQQAMMRARTLAQLLILHYDSKRQQRHQFTEKKMYPRSNDARSKKRGKRNLKYSLFRTINIDYHGDYGRSDIVSGVTRRPLDHSFPVRGHFRWQAYGKKFSKHKLLWIDSHVRGSGDLDTRGSKSKIMR